MKLTPEQKSILAYGETRGILKERKSLMRFTEGSGECSDYHGEPRMMYGVEEAIRDDGRGILRKAGHAEIAKTDTIITALLHAGNACATPPRNIISSCSYKTTGSQERRLAMINILLSVRRPFSEKILSGEKKWELRKTKPIFRRCGPVTLWFYESGKEGNGLLSASAS